MAYASYRQEVQFLCLRYNSRCILREFKKERVVKTLPNHGIEFNEIFLNRSIKHLTFVFGLMDGVRAIHQAIFLKEG